MALSGVSDLSNLTDLSALAGPTDIYFAL